MNTVRKIAENINSSQDFIGSVCFNEDMKKHTTFKIGGQAALFVKPATTKSLCILLDSIKRHHSNYFLIGNGSNLVVSEKGFKGVVISTELLNSISIEKKDKDYALLHCGAGILFDKIIEFCIKNGYSGLEAFAGLPASAGGATFMNARCYGTSICDILNSCEYITEEKNMITVNHYTMNTKDWAYKESPFTNRIKNASIVQSSFIIKKDSKKTIEGICKKNIEDRRKKGHFEYPCAGSVFKNNRLFGKPSGCLIDEAGLKGIRCGDAQIAPWHGNFIVNNGSATADDIKRLVEIAIDKVQKMTGHRLECEIIFCGD